jgi:RND family efflux transporter MFP subunit
MYAPIDGRIGEAQVEVGNLVSGSSTGGSNSQLATIQQLDPMGVDLQVSSRYLKQAARLIREGQSVHMTWPGPEGQEEHPYDGRLYFYDNAIDPLTSTFLVKAKVPNPGGTLLPGEYVKLDMTIGELKDAIVVPEQAVAETQAGPVVYVIDDEGKVAIQKVDAALTYEGLRVVSAGLVPGRRVIVEGIQLVRPGIAVKAEPAMLPNPARSVPEGQGPAPAAEGAPTAGAAGAETGPDRPRRRPEAGPGPGGPRSAVKAAEPAAPAAEEAAPPQS